MRNLIAVVLGLSLVGRAWAGCDHAYFPVQEGWAWTYQSSLEGQTHTITISKVSDSGFTYTVQFEKGSVETRWKCDAEGLSSLEYSAANFGGKTSQFNFKTVARKGVIIPNNLAVGSRWTYGFTLEGEISGKKVVNKLETSNKIVGEETVTVPAGTFKAVKVESTSVMNMSMDLGGKSRNMPSNTIKSTSWYGPGVGLVKSVISNITTELVSWKK